MPRRKRRARRRSLKNTNCHGERSGEESEANLAAESNHPYLNSTPREENGSPQEKVEEFPSFPASIHGYHSAAKSTQCGFLRTINEIF